jgi:hypothetical protein
MARILSVFLAFFIASASVAGAPRSPFFYEQNNAADLVNL